MEGENSILNVMIDQKMRLFSIVLSLQQGKKGTRCLCFHFFSFENYYLNEMKEWKAEPTPLTLQKLNSI